MRANANTFYYDGDMTQDECPDAARLDCVGVKPNGLKYLLRDYARPFLGLIRAGERIDSLLDADLRRRYGIGLRAFEILLFLSAYSEEGSDHMANLAKRTPLSQSRISRLVADLEVRGLVSRSTSSGDARAVTVAVTDEGVELFKRAQETHLNQLNDLIFSRLTRRELVMLAKITDKLLDDHQMMSD
ncbi:MAG: MarR family transcriptional regulator [Acidimicrobiia bacterium]|nr:MarR family transcriptional regulator [Acidimicrobiia bacterium]